MIIAKMDFKPVSRLKICLAVVLVSFWLTQSPAIAACNPPADYRDCPSSYFGTNGVALMDSQYNPIETDFANLRQIAHQSNPATNYQRLQATIILSDGTIADVQKTTEIFMIAEKYGIDITIRTWGNIMDINTAAEMGENLSQAINTYRSATGHDIRVELGNEPNLDTTGAEYAKIFVAFTESCTGCQVYLPSLGGTDMTDKQIFIQEFMANSEAAAAAAKATGIIFNSYGGDPNEAITDWINTLIAWQQAGIDTTNMKYFLTETGPPNGDLRWPNLETFLSGIAKEYIAIKNDPSHPLYQQFSKLEGLTFFIWDQDQKTGEWVLKLVFIDNEGRLIIRESRKSVNLPGKIPLSPPKQRGGTKTAPLRGYPEEMEIECMNWGESPPRPGLPQYTDAACLSRPSMRGDINLISSVKGIHCGQTKSTPIYLKEVATYSLFESPKCKTTWWMGEVGYNYELKPKYNLKVPFAEQLNRFWTGELDAEHMSEAEIEKIFHDAVDINPLNFITSFFNVFNTVGDARKKIDQKSGVLKKLTPAGQMDRLKCNLVNYVKEKCHSGEGSLYCGFQIDGRPLVNLSCPPAATDDSNPLTNNMATNFLWFTQNSQVWSKLPLFPNEKGQGQLILNLCADRQYIEGINYPEVFRLGLASNQLFQTLMPKSGQEALYTYMPNYGDLRNPLRSPALLSDSSTSTDKQEAEMTSNNYANEQSEPFLGWLKKLTDLVTTLLTGKAFTTAKAQAPGEIIVTPEAEIINGLIQYRVTINVPVDGHVTTELWVDGQKIGGTVNAVRAGGTLVYGTPGYAPSGAEIFSPLTGDHKIEFLVKCDDCNIPQQGQEIWVSCSAAASGGNIFTTCPVKSGPEPPKGDFCGGPNRPPCKDYCPVTPECPQTGCRICARGQKGPPDTTVWPVEYPGGHTILGVNWTAFNAGYTDQADNDPVLYTFEIPQWEPGDPLPGDCRYENSTGRRCADGCLEGTECDSSFGLCVEIGKSISLVCQKTHFRTIDVYNRVPFLASAWQEIAGYAQGKAPGGVLNIFKPSQISGSGLHNPVGCNNSKEYTLDALGNFMPNPGVSEVTYDFHTHFGFEIGKQFTHPDLTVDQVSPGKTEAAKITFYRLGGLCNANAWVSERVVIPSGIRVSLPDPSQCEK